MSPTFARYLESEKRVHLLPTFKGDPSPDPFDELDSPNAADSKRTRRRIAGIGVCIVIWALFMVFYAVDVDRSWRALEKKWARQEMAQQGSDGYIEGGWNLNSNTTRIWGHSHNDEMQGKDAFVSDP